MTNKEIANKWMKGNNISSVDLGGMGEEYEKAIQKALFNFFVYLIKKNISWEKLINKKTNEFNKYSDKILLKVVKGMGLSGAQAGQAKGTAYQFLRYGYQYMMDKAPKDRIILITKKGFLMKIMNY